MKSTRLLLINSGIISLFFVIAFMLSLTNYPVASGILLFIMSVMLFYKYFKFTGSFTNLRSLFLVSWGGAISLSALRIHPLQTMWSIETWIILWSSFVCFLLGYEMSPKLKIKGLRLRGISKLNLLYLLFCIVILSLAFETITMHGLPAFSEDMGAYQDFHVGLIHYFTVSCVLFLPLTIEYIFCNNTTRFQKIILVIMNIIMFIIPILIVSRRFILMNIIISALTFFRVSNLDRKIKLKYVFRVIIILIGAWLLLSMLRKQDSIYLYRVLGLDDKLPVALYVPYLYISFNIDNFNSIVGTVTQYSYGFQSFFPIWGLTKLKYFWPDYITGVTVKQNLIGVYTTYSFLLTPYLDAGGLGVALYCILLGVISGVVERNTLVHNNYIVLQSLITYCLLFSFFAAFLSSQEMVVFCVIAIFFKMYDKKRNIA